MRNLTRFTPERNPKLYQISRGDILLNARGQEHHAYLVDSDFPEVLASNVFYIIRPLENVVPGYLAWWLNAADAQALLDTMSYGTAIGYISRSDLEQLLIPIPPLAMQRRVAEVMTLWQVQRDVQARLDEKREQLVHAVCRNAVHLNHGVSS